MRAYYEIPVGFEPIPNTRSLIQQRGLMYLMLIPSPYYLMFQPEADIQQICSQFIRQHIHDQVDLTYQFNHHQALIGGLASFERSQSPKMKIFDTATRQASIDLYTVAGQYEPGDGYYEHAGLDVDHDQTLSAPTESLANLQADALLFNPKQLQISEIQFAEYAHRK